MKRETTIRMDELNFRTILKDILKNAVFIILAVMIAVMGIRTYKNIVYVPEYTANATLAVMAKGNASNDTYSSLSTASSMAEVFSEVFQSDVMKEKIEEDLGSIPADTAIKSSLIPETNLLVLSVTAKDPQAAYRILQSILENYPDVSDYIFGNAVLEVVMDPEVPVGPSNALNTSKLEKLGILGAAGLIIALTIIFSILRDTIKTSRSAKRYLEGECLAVLPYETKNKTLKSKIKKINKAVLLNNPVIGFEYEEGCHRLASRLEFKTRTDEEKIILVTSVAENEGKSTVAINLAMALARKNKRVLLVDMDFPKPAVYKLLDQKVNKKRSLLNFLNGGIALRDVVQYDAQKRIYTILNSQSSEEIHKYLTPRCMGSFFRTVKASFDYVILDSAPLSAGTDTNYLQEYADAELLVIREDRVMISDLNDAVETMKEGDGKFLGYVLNGFSKYDSKISGYGYGRYGKYGRYGNYGRDAAEND